MHFIKPRIVSINADVGRIDCGFTCSRAAMRAKSVANARRRLLDCGLGLLSGKAIESILKLCTVNHLLYKRIQSCSVTTSAKSNIEDSTSCRDT